MARRATIVGVVLAVVTAVGLVGGGTAFADDPPVITYTSGSYSESILASCARTGLSSQTLTASYTNVPYDTSVSTDEYDCAHRMFEIMREEALGHYGSVNMAAHLQALIFSGRGRLTDRYETYLDNIDISILMMETLSDTELGYCTLTTQHLMVACPDLSGGTISIPALGMSNVPTGGLYSQGGGTTYGNVFLVNGIGQWTVYGNFDDPANSLTLHHEQVHAQQWARSGTSFWYLYLQDYSNAMTKSAQKSANPTGSPSYWAYEPGCNSSYEQQASLTDPGYVCTY